MKKILATSTALAALLLVAPTNTSLVFAQGKSDSASKGESNGRGGGDRGKSESSRGNSDSAPGQDQPGDDGDGNAGGGNNPGGMDPDNPGRSMSDSAPGQNKPGLDGDGNAGGGNNLTGVDPDNPGKSKAGTKPDDDDDMAGDRTPTANVVATLNSPRKLEQALSQFADLENPEFNFVPFNGDDLDVAIKGGSSRAIINALNRNPELKAQIDAILPPGVELADVVGFQVNDTTEVVTVFLAQ